jgi:hypothetical protein
MEPSLAGFIAFLQNVVGITTAQLPANSPTIPFALSLAMAIANQTLACIPIPQTDASGVALNAGGQNIYIQAVYNLGTSFVFAYAQDPAGAPVIKGSGDPGLPFFAWSRQQWQINSFVSGVVQSTADESTSTSLVVQEAAKYFTIANLSQLKDPWGRMYISLAQSFGPSTFGLS